MNEVLDRKKFIAWAAKLAFPIMVQNLISTLVTTADTVMLGYVNQTAMSASSLANEYTFVLTCIYFGLATATSVLCGQYWGKGDSKTIERIIGLAERLALVSSIIFSAISFFFPEFIMQLFTSSPETIAVGSEYLRVISISYIFMGFSQVYVSALRSVGRVVFPSVVFVVSLCVNVTLNATFIFGLFGAPSLGVVGVALGTVAARIVEVIMCLIHSAWSSQIKFRVKYLFARAGILVKDFMKIAFPAIGNDLIWGLATSVFASILGHIGDDIVAANAVAVMVVNIGAIALRGFASATTIVISTTLGAGNTAATKIYAKRMLRLTAAVGVVGCAIILAIRPFVMDFYRGKLTDTAIEYLGAMMIMTTWRMIGEGINTCLICGCFRGGGDTKFGMILDTIFMWAVAIPIMAAAAYLLRLPPIWVYFAMTLDEFEKMPVVWAHYKKYKWMQNITRDMNYPEGE